MLTHAITMAKVVARRAAPNLYAALAPGLLDWWRGVTPVTPVEYPTEDLRSLGAAFGRQFGYVVLNGPFRGMKYVATPGEGNLIPKLLGSYEEELQSIIRLVMGRRYDAILNIGCAEGYYAVGLALSIPGARVRAFDINDAARRLCAELAHMNGVADRISVEAVCDRTTLRALTDERTLIVCDCEGAEAELFDGRTVAALRSSDVLMELHDFIDPTISRMMIHHFSRSHRTTLVTSVTRDPAAYPQLAGLRPADQLRAVNEFRPSTCNGHSLRRGLTRRPSSVHGLTQHREYRINDG